MASVSLNAYDADIRINEFMGLEPFGDHFNGDLRFAADARNLDVVGGMLQSPAQLRTYRDETDQETSYTIPGEGPIQTLATFMRQNYAGSMGSNQEALIAAAGGQLYYKAANDYGAWQQLAMPQNFGSDHYSLNYWSWATYEMNNAENVLLMSNNTDGMIMIRSGTSLAALPVVEKVTTAGYKFDTITVYGERVWGAAIKANRDSIVYSAKFDPQDWTPNAQNPEDGAGVIRQPTWDGDTIVRLQPFAGHLLVIMQRHIWRIYGKTPSEFTITEQFGEGAYCERSVIAIGERVFMAGQYGVNIYDGQISRPYLQEQTKTFWENVDFGLTLDSEHRRAVNAIVYKNQYILAVPLYGIMDEGTEYETEYLDGIHLLIYDLTYGTVNIKTYQWANVYDMCTTKYKIFFTAGISIAEYQPDVWADGCTSPNQDMSWLTPWVDFQNAKIGLTDFDVHFLPEVKSTKVDLVFTIETEKGAVEKVCTVQPLTGREIADGKAFPYRRLRFHIKGKRFRMKIERRYMSRIRTSSMTNDEFKALSTAPWRLIGGIHIVADTERDD